MGKVIKTSHLILGFLIVIFFSAVIPVSAQKNVTGTVTDANTGKTMPGVNIAVKGTTIGTSSDNNGYYMLNVPSLQDTLVVSFVGYQTRNISINKRDEINIKMASQAISGQELVVVGYGTQQKSNLTGSVSSANMEQVSKQGVTQASQSLAGAVSGLTVTQPSGNPGSNQAELRIRGTGTFSGAGNNPLVIVDGAPSSMSNVNPNDIASISVLKDAASAAIYGSRAANGVVIITTKEGSAGKLQVDYNSYVGKREATDLPDVANSYISALAWNAAYTNTGQAPRFTQEEVQKFKSGNYPDEYPNFNHVKNLFTSGNGLQTKHNLAISGGTENSQYRFSTGFLRENSIIAKNSLDRYNVRLNINSNLGNDFTLNAKLHGQQSLKHEPARISSQGSRAEGISGVIKAGVYMPSTIAGRKSDGTYGHFKGHPVAEAVLDSKSFAKNNLNNMGGNASLDWDIINSLKLTASVDYQIENRRYHLFGAETFVNPNMILGPANALVRDSQNSNLVLKGLVNYDKTINKNHHIHVLGGVSQTKYADDYLSGFRDEFPSNDISVLNAASVVHDENGNSGSSWAIESYFGRINYSYQGKYLLEINARYDGSSRFSKGNRYGFFPSISAGWNVANENFFQLSWIQNLKLRGSYGSLGNQQIGTYPYQRTLQLGYDYTFGTARNISSGISLSQLPFQNISWETTTIADVGLDIGLFEDKLNFTVDYYNKKTKDILYNLTVSDVLGRGVSAQNAGVVGNKGWDFDLSYRNTIGGFSFSIRPNLSIVRNKVLDLAGVRRDINKGLFIGSPIQAFYGYVADGLFNSEEDIKNYAKQNYSPVPGDVRFKDISGPNGKPDGKVTAEYDRKIIGTSFPPYSFGLGVSANYNGFDFSLLLQGQGGHNGYKYPTLNSFTGGDGFFDLNDWKNRWKPDQPTKDTSYPRFKDHNSENYWGAVSTYWMRNGTYLRIKNVQLGYSLPPNIIKNIPIKNLRIYVSGRNIATFDSYVTGYDPEMRQVAATFGGGGTPEYYPPTRIWRVGLSLKF